MSNDDAFIHSLRSRAEAVAPSIDVESTAPSGSASPTAARTAAGTYWYTRTVHTNTHEDGEGESWLSREVPGLLVWDGDLARASGVGPRGVIGRFKIDGQWIDMLRDPALLPWDSSGLTAVLRASVEPDRASGTADDKVFGMALDILQQGGLLPTELLEAAWGTAAAMPGAVTSTGTDSTGRPGQILDWTWEGSPVLLVRDPETGLLLESVRPAHTNL